MYASWGNLELKWSAISGREFHEMPNTVLRLVSLYSALYMFGFLSPRLVWWYKGRKNYCSLFFQQQSYSAINFQQDNLYWTPWLDKPEVANMSNALFLQYCRKNHCLKTPLFKKTEQVYFVSNNATVKKSQFFKTTEVNIRKRLVYKMISKITSPEKQDISSGRYFKTPWHLTQNFFLFNMNFIDSKLITMLEISLTHFQPMFHIYTPCKYRKTRGFLMFSGGIEVDHWLKMG